MELLNMLGKSYIQTLVFILSALSVFIIYWLKNRSKIKTAARILIFQIKEIENNILYLKKECINNDFSINETNIFISNSICTTSEWDKYNYILLDHFSSDDINLISIFYENAKKLNSFQSDVKSFILFSLQNKAQNRYSFIYNSIIKCENEFEIREAINNIDQKMDACNTKAYIPLHYGVYLSKHLSLYNCLSGTTVYAKLEKLSKKKWFT